jgi:ubiquinone/menaquinone biosynthesis C-methylase UbiE
MLAIAKAKLDQTAELRLEDAARMTFGDGTFDLVTVVLTLHEMASALRSAVLRECRRVAREDGRIMLMDYHDGPYPFPSGWAWKSVVTSGEISAGRAHYANYRDFIRRGALQGLVEEQRFTVETRLVGPSGTAAVYLLEP